jgi:hypothetical protein
MFFCFSFPKDVTERNKWFQSLGVEINSQRFTFLCSDHFLSSDFYTEPSGRRRLKKDAMPTSSGSGVICTSSSTSASSVTSEETLDCASNLPVQEKETLALPLSSSSSATKSASECGELKEKSVTSLMGPPQKR